MCFNSHGSNAVWDAKEWEFFLDDVVKNVLSESGEIYFELNPEPSGYYTPELAEFFRRRGAQMEGKRSGSVNEASRAEGLEGVASAFQPVLTSR